MDGGMTLVKKIYRMERSFAAAWLLTVACTAVSSAGPIQVIDDRSFFNNIPHTLIDFETRGDGTQYSFGGQGDFVTIAPDEYSNHGVLISSPSQHFLSPAVVLSPSSEPNESWFKQDASSPNFLVDGTRHGFLRFDFPEGVNAISISALRISNIDSDPVVMTAYHQNGSVLGALTLTESLIDGTVSGSQNGLPFDYEFGFFGLFSPSEEIAYAVIDEDLSSFDDLYFAIVPEPSSIFLLLISVFGLSYSRRSRITSKTGLGFFRFFVLFTYCIGQTSISANITETVKGNIVNGRNAHR